MTTKFPKVKDTLLFKEMDDGAIVYDPLEEICYSLNATSAYIWSLCDGKNSLDDIIFKIKTDFESFKISPDEALQDILENFKKNDLLE